MSMKRRTRRALLLLALGVIITYVVGWTADLRRPLALANNAPHLPARWVRPVPPHWPPVESVHATPGRRPYFTFYCAYTPTPHGPDPQVQHRQEHWRTGWPFRALQRTDTYDYTLSYATTPGLPAPIFSIERGVGLPRWLRTPSCTALSIRPIWAGLIGNATLAAAACGVILFGPAAGMRWRRERRRRRDECARCRYELRGLSTCPECGTRSNPR